MRLPGVVSLVLQDTQLKLLIFGIFFSSYSVIYGEMRATQEHEVKSNHYREVHD